MSIMYILGLSTLQKWASKIDIKTGILSGVINLIQVAGATMSPIEKLVVIQYDEMKVAERYEFDVKNDQVIGLHKQLQIVNARSLCGSWKQPIYADFDKKITPDLLNELMKQLHNIGFRVVACVSDCGPTNTGLWTSLGLSLDKSWILHPCTDKKVYFFADAPHMLKLLRNWLLDTGFILKNGERITKGPLEELLQMRTEISSVFKLNKLHLECQGPQRQRVFLACNLLSNTTAKALEYYNPEGNKEYFNLSTFIAAVNNWFDVMNSYVPSDKTPFKSGYGRADLKKIQDDSLNEMHDIVLNMRRINKKGMLKFQKGILMSIRSLQGLYEDLKSDYNISYVLTHKLNQDCLENLFSQLRTRGGLNDHPTPLDALNRLRIIILGKSVIVQSKTNTLDQSEGETYVVGKVLKRTGINLVSRLQVDSATNEAESLDSLSSNTSPSPAGNAVGRSPTLLDKEEDGLQYLAGWLARKLKNKYPHLGKYTYLNKKEHCYSLPSWVQHLSFGGLMEPSEQLMQDMLVMEKLFRKYYGDKVNNSRGINAKLLQTFKSRTLIDEDILSAFIRQRIFIRINFLNSKLEEEKRQMYKQKRFRDEGDDKQSKKMKKVTT